jgi:hypothetical protein
MEAILRLVFVFLRNVFVFLRYAASKNRPVPGHHFRPNPQSKLAN